ncbi:uncharacterized protein LOC127526093 [Erpetoichthys calabaricus]|uniref:uncharacterized protein LOC127526093 n=1 Tax=Erpetoichthys calabaricus TaxID=27687 RepID=UPI0022344A40|nr:uncharacterized protein LOC127526093 [Erpetoichthys calabaricus]
MINGCTLLPPDEGYKKARKQLESYYGNQAFVVDAYISKALKWPQIKQRDGEALRDYATFLDNCMDSMTKAKNRVAFNSNENIRTILSKLPYSLQNKWGDIAYEIEEEEKKEIEICDLTIFLHKQAKIFMHHIYGSKEKKEKTDNVRSPLKYGQKSGSIYTTSITDTAEKGTQEISVKKSANDTCAFKKPCVFCNGQHILAECRKIKELPHKERIDFLKSKGLCFRCLKQGHLGKNCKERMKCQTCSFQHPDILHIKKDSEATSKAATNVVTPTEKETETGTCNFTGAGEECALQVVPVKVKSKKGERYVETYAFIDQGSTVTICTERLQKQLNLQGRRTQVFLKTMNNYDDDSKVVTQSSVLSDLQVCGVNDDEYIDLPKVFTQVPVDRENIPLQEDIDKWAYLKEVRLTHIDSEVDILIGINYPEIFKELRTIPSQGGGPYAMKTALGWVVGGPYKEIDDLTKQSGKMPKHSINHMSITEIEDMLLQQYNTDFLERSCEEKEEMSQEDIKFMRISSESSSLVGGQYSLNLPLKDETLKMPNNRCIAEQRAIGLRRKLSKNSGFHGDYKAFMKDIIDKGYAVKVPKENLNCNEGRVWYIPHHGVYHPKKNKIRVVFDCTATYQGISLNEQLLKGPDLTNTLIGVLTRFRKEPVALMADIKSMFYQVKVPDKDSDLLRFLWWPEGNLSKDLEEFKMTVHLFGATSSPSCASYALRRTAEDARDTFPEEAVNTVLNNFYVDDCLRSVTTEEQAIKLAKDLQALCLKGGFQLTKWKNNQKTP